ncbi:hypothetical protein ACHAW6_012508 [Cyclotella cf. meneghiniana]
MTTPSFKYDSFNYLVIDGLSIECTPSGNEVYFTPDIDIHKNLSMSSATSSVHAQTGARAIKHLNTFSVEEEEEAENVFMNFSICSTNEEENVDERCHDLVKETIIEIHDDNTVTKDIGSTDSNYLPGRYQRPRDSFERSSNTSNQLVIAEQPQSKPQEHHPSRPVLNVITSLLPPSTTGIATNENDDNQWPDENRRAPNISSPCDPRCPYIPKELDPRSPRPFAELRPNSQQIYALNVKRGDGVRSIKTQFTMKIDGISKKWVD